MMTLDLKEISDSRVFQFTYPYIQLYDTNKENPS